MTRKRGTPHARAKESLNTPTKALDLVERIGSRWWSGWKNHVTDTVAISKSMLDPGYSSAQFVRDATATWLNLPRALLCIGPDHNAVIELDIDSNSEASDVDTVRLSKAARVIPALTADLKQANGRATIDKKYVKVWLSGNSKTTLNACLAGIKLLSPRLAPGEYTGTIELGTDRPFPISVYRSDA
jgi:hypothetical protein